MVPVASGSSTLTNSTAGDDGSSFYLFKALGLNQAGSPPSFSSAGSQTDDAALGDVAWVGLSGVDTDWTGVEAPPAGETRVYWCVITAAGVTWTLKHNTGSSLGNRFDLPGGKDVVVTAGVVFAIVYNTTAGGGFGAWQVMTAVAPRQTPAGVTGLAAAGTGTALKDDSTSTGGVGSTAVTFGDVVAALKALNILPQ